jgi:hypothetical protein
MSRPATTNNVKRALRRGVLAATLAALIGIFSAGISAAGAEQTFSVFVHIQYPDGFVYEHAFATGVPASGLGSILAECGRSHKWGAGSAVQYHCFAQPE